MTYHFLVVDNTFKDIDRAVYNRVADALENEFGKDIIIEYRGMDEDGLCITKDYFMIIAIGGDGTMLKVLNSLNGHDIPVIGINLGRVGFLAEIEPNNIENAIHEIAIGNHHIKKHNYLEGYVNDAPISACAVNDIIIGKSNFLTTVQLELIIDDVSVNTYICDGINISSAIGSTAYNKALGGPVIYPESPVISITPISTNDNLFKSLIIPDTSRIEVKIHRVGGVNDYCAIGFDGRNEICLDEGDSIHIKKSEKKYSILHLNDYDYYAVLKKKK